MIDRAATLPNSSWQDYYCAYLKYQIEPCGETPLGKFNQQKRSRACESWHHFENTQNIQELFWYMLTKWYTSLAGTVSEKMFQVSWTMHVFVFVFSLLISQLLSPLKINLPLQQPRIAQQMQHSWKWSNMTTGTTKICNFFFLYNYTIFHLSLLMTKFKKVT